MPSSKTRMLEKKLADALAEVARLRKIRKESDVLAETTLGGVLRALRLESKLSLSEASIKMGVKGRSIYSWLSAVEHERTPVSLKNLQRASEAYGIPVSAILQRWESAKLKGEKES